MDECNPNRSGAKRRRLGKKVILVVIAAILTHSLVLASIAAPLYLQAPAFLMERGDYAKAYQIALKSEKNSILAESTMVEVIRKHSEELYHPSSFELLGCVYTACLVDGLEYGVARMAFMIKYRALSLDGTRKVVIWKYGGVDCGYVDETYDGLEDDENGRMYTYVPVIDIPGIELIKMTQKQLDRINKRAADETLGNITPVPAGKIDYSLIPERKD